MMSVASIATPVATVIGALLLAFPRQNAVDNKKKYKVEAEIGPIRLEELGSMGGTLPIHPIR